MKKYIDILQECPIFADISKENLISILSCLDAKVLRFSKNEAIFLEGDSIDCVGILLSGNAQIIRNDYYGNRNIITNIEPSQLFGESFAFAEVNSIPVSVISTDTTEVLLIKSHKISKACNNSCDFHNRLILNLLKIMAMKNIFFNQKSEITSKKTTKEKLLAYLMHQAKLNNSNKFTIPFNRQELADFLEVDRSGLSVEISKLRQNKIIECHKNNFTLLK